MIQLLPSIEDARLIRDALNEFRVNNAWHMSDEKMDRVYALIATVSVKIVDASK